jgi:hypothetical protein
VSKVFRSDVFDWARDLAVIQRIFGIGVSQPHTTAAEPVDLQRARKPSPSRPDLAAVEPADLPAQPPSS